MRKIVVTFCVNSGETKIWDITNLGVVPDSSEKFIDLMAVFPQHFREVDIYDLVGLKVHIVTEYEL